MLCFYRNIRKPDRKKPGKFNESPFGDGKEDEA